jgi:hypothetical protein
MGCNRMLVAVVCLVVGGMRSHPPAIAGVMEYPYAGADRSTWQTPGRPCDTEIRYDDGIDDTPGWAPALFWVEEDVYQALSVRFQPPEAIEYLVERAAWFSPAWYRPGWVDVIAREVGDATNMTMESVWIADGGTGEVDFSAPICIPPGAEFLILMCPRWNTAGLIGDDSSDVDGRSYYSEEAGVCEPEFSTSEDLMIWSCVRPCGGVPAGETSWGWIKSMFR